MNKMTNAAHKRNIGIILDLVANHVHEEHPIYKMHPDWQRRSICRTDAKISDYGTNTASQRGSILSCLPSTMKTRSVKYMVDSSLYWLTAYGLDGFRHDATKHIPNVFWQTLTQRIKKEVVIPKKRSILQIGETYGSRELIGSYVGSGQMDGQFDFNLFFDARAVFALDNEPFEKLQTSLRESMQYYGYHSLMGNITGNHDMARFISYAGEDLRFEENAKKQAGHAI